MPTLSQRNNTPEPASKNDTPAGESPASLRSEDVSQIYDKNNFREGSWASKLNKDNLIVDLIRIFSTYQISLSAFCILK